MTNEEILDLEPVVRYWAARYARIPRTTLSFDDWYQTAWLAVLQNRSKWDPERGKLSVWATYYIRRTLSRVKRPPIGDEINDWTPGYSIESNQDAETDLRFVDNFVKRVFKPRDVTIYKERIATNDPTDLRTLGAKLGISQQMVHVDERRIRQYIEGLLN